MLVFCWFGFVFFFKREVRNPALWKGLFKDNFLQRSSGTPNIHRDILLRTRLSVKKTQSKQKRGTTPLLQLRRSAKDGQEITSSGMGAAAKRERGNKRPSIV